MTTDDLRTRRERLHLSQRALAGALGVGIRTVNGWERGRSPIPRAVELALDAWEDNQVVAFRG